MDLGKYSDKYRDKSVKLFENPVDASHLSLKWMEMKLLYENSLQGH